MSTSSGSDLKIDMISLFSNEELIPRFPKENFGGHKDWNEFSTHPWSQPFTSPSTGITTRLEKPVLIICTSLTSIVFLRHFWDYPEKYGTKSTTSSVVTSKFLQCSTSGMNGFVFGIQEVILLTKAGLKDCSISLFIR